MIFVLAECLPPPAGGGGTTGARHVMVSFQFLAALPEHSGASQQYTWHRPLVVGSTTSAAAAAAR